MNKLNAKKTFKPLTIKLTVSFMYYSCYTFESDINNLLNITNLLNLLKTLRFDLEIM